MSGERRKWKQSRCYPIGIEDFEKLRTEDFYYVDKTGMIRELLTNRSEVNLFTRSRGFCKSLNMSMRKYFFGYGSDPSLFGGLEIAKDRELCEQNMGKFPVISITLKGVEFMNFETVRAALCSVVGARRCISSFSRRATGFSNRKGSNIAV